MSTKSKQYVIATFNGHVTGNQYTMISTYFESRGGSFRIVPHCTNGAMVERRLDWCAKNGHSAFSVAFATLAEAEQYTRDTAEYLGSRYLPWTQAHIAF